MTHKVVRNSCFGGFGISQEAIRWLSNKYGLTLEQIDEMPRHDKRLVRCVEELGEEANAEYAKLKVETIDSDRYLLEEYDGLETVKTPDDTIPWTVIGETDGKEEER